MWNRKTTLEFVEESKIKINHLLYRTGRKLYIEK